MSRKFNKVNMYLVKMSSLYIYLFLNQDKIDFIKNRLNIEYIYKNIKIIGYFKLLFINFYQKYIIIYILKEK